MATQGCPCGYRFDPKRECGYHFDPKRECGCTPMMIKKYVGKISGPLLDRIDLHIEVPALEYKDLSTESGCSLSTSLKPSSTAPLTARAGFDLDPQINCISLRLIGEFCAFHAYGLKWCRRRTSNFLCPLFHKGGRRKS